MTDRIPLDNLNSDQLDALYDRLDRARDAAALHRQGLITTAELYAAIEAQPEPVPAATGATEPAMITDPAYLHHLYADAIRNTPARYPDDIATAIMNVRDRHMQQLRQRLDLAAAELNERNKQDSADAAAGSYAHRAEHAEQQRDQLAAVLREVLDQFADWPTDGFPWPQGGVVARVDPTEWDRWDTVHTAITAPPAHLAELVGDTTLEDQ